ncbi:bifunctional 2',3'-cyclic-nucleotide 2'-phosphodiesterase/3'-nucleotidase [Rhodanobacter aciditrophus]|uniref:bifunctional 2',3'-cyclic-nucleotide 2'-phosphodiesterase/3'-nucleotidase n=1 Tax=Rhodanobacter aciditrophus TaxID=1623218 RepID=UPI003CF96307
MFPRRTSLALLATALLAGCARQPVRTPALPDGTHATVAILETTDIHSNILGYDYYKQKADPTLGFDRTATLIGAARKEFPNHFLFDSGDTIQGSVLADWQAQVQKMPCDRELAIYRAMDAVGYDGGTIGNHEFNYGLGWLSQVTGTPMDVDGGARGRCDGPHFPLVLANVDSARDGAPIFRPWTIVSKPIAVQLPDGRTENVPLRVAIVGFTPPPILEWDRQNLAGKVTVDGVVEAAKKYLPQIQAQHPDLVVAIVHGGLDTAPYTPAMENAGWHLAGVPGIDVMLLGHSHTEFPGPRFAHMKDVDDVRGFVRGVPAVMGGFFGKDLGVVELALDRRDGRWIVDKGRTHSEVRPICSKPGDAASCVASDPAIAPLVAKVQQAAVAYVNTPIGRSELRLSSYFADEGDMTALAVVNAAQRDYVRTELPRLHPELANVPVLSAAAAFRTGFGGPDDYTDVAPGPLTLRSAADLYFYPNTLAAVRTDGAGVKAWLEESARRFQHIDPAKNAPQALINTHFPGFNFDQMQGGIHYVIDVSKPAGQRIVSLTYEGKPVRPDQPFIMVTNNYRASGGGRFPGLDGSNIVLAAPDGTREIVARWIERHRAIGARDLPARSWRFAKLQTAGPVVFTSASGKAGIAKSDGLDHVRELKDHGDGTATYAIDLSR